MKPSAPSGAILNANFAVAGDWPVFEITFESGDGKGRNSDYTAGMDLVLQRLADRRATLLGAYVNSLVANRRKATEGLDVTLNPDDFTFPLLLDPRTEPSSLRRSLGRAGALVGKPPTGSGNTTKRVTLRIGLPERSGLEAPELELELASPSVDPTDSEVAQVPYVSTVDMAELEELRLRYLNASPKIRIQLSRRIERGAVGDKVKAANKHRCQICEQLGLPSIAFFKPDGTPYAEAHHIVLVASLQPGALGPQNVICVCPNHHRELHYGNVSVLETQDVFVISLGDQTVRIVKNGSSRPSPP